jgi:carbon-monoxide dehydrogenase large subunit
MNKPAFNVEGLRVTRMEDARLLTGRGRFAADWSSPQQLHGSFLRSDRAHARIVAIDVAAARAAPGVRLVLTGADAIEAGYVRPLSFIRGTGKNGMQARIPDRPVLAHGKVRFVGDPVAFVVADSAESAADAAQLIRVDYADENVVVAADAALADGAPLLHDSIPGNLCFETEAGDLAAVEAAFARAAHVTRLNMHSTRVVPNPMEPRACLVAFDPATESYTLNVPVQGVEMMRRQLAGYTGLAPEKIKAVARDVGGGFGSRSMGYPEYCCAMIAARRTGRPVKWISSRTEALLSDTHGRSNLISGELALDRDGRFLALKLDWIADVGAYSTPPNAIAPMANGKLCMTGAYRIPALYGRWRVAYTNAAPIGNYRGAGRPDIAYAVERLVGQAAVEMGIDPVEIRRRNLIEAAAMPFTTATGSTYENADFLGMMGKALELSDWHGFAARRADSARRGLLRGRGLSTVIENTSPGNFPRDELALEVDRDGAISVTTLGHSQGQAHETTLALIVARELGIAPEQIRVRQEHREKTLTGNHTGGSRTMVGPGSLCFLGARELIERGKRMAADRLNVEPSQIAYAAGYFGTAESSARVSIADLARSAPIEIIASGSFGYTFPNDCHVVEVEVDPETGKVAIVSYIAVDDCGVVINPIVVEGQLHGAVAQGVGQVLGEHAVYEEHTGQMLTATFLDYFMPRAGLIPFIREADHPTASQVSPLGAKGMGESGCTASIPALVEAVMDALRPLGVVPLEMPLTPLKIWQALQTARERRPAGRRSLPH